MNRIVGSTVFVATVGAVALAAHWLPTPTVATRAAHEWTDAEWRRIVALSPRPEVRLDSTNRLDGDDLAAAWGQWIFFDDGFARGPALSCADCHQPDRWFTDGATVALGRLPGDRNTPTVVDAALQRWFFWDGRADTLWSQAIEAFEDERELASTRLAVVRRLATDPELRAAHEAAAGPLPDPTWFDARPADATPRRPPDHPHRRAWEGLPAVDRDVVDRVFSDLGKAIAAYESRLVSGPAPFDRWVTDRLAGGDGGGHLGDDAVRGLRLFIGRADCLTCHLGGRFSDGAFHATGVPSSRPGLQRDPGRRAGLAHAQADPFNAAGAYSDDPDGVRGTIVRRSIGSPDDHAAFRTPGLRAIAETAPYMHAGQLDTLEDVVRFYSTLDEAERFDHHGQAVLRPLGLSEGEIADLVAFLESLTGTPPPEHLRRRPVTPLGRTAAGAPESR